MILCTFDYLPALKVLNITGLWTTCISFSWEAGGLVNHILQHCGLCSLPEIIIPFISKAFNICLIVCPSFLELASFPLEAPFAVSSYLANSLSKCFFMDPHCSVLVIGRGLLALLLAHLRCQRSKMLLWYPCLYLYCWILEISFPGCTAINLHT